MMVYKYSVKQLSETLIVETYSASSAMRNQKYIFSYRIKKFVYKNRVEYEINSNMGSDLSDVGHSKPILECSKAKFDKIYAEAETYFQELFKIKIQNSE